MRKPLILAGNIEVKFIQESFAEKFFLPNFAATKTTEKT